MVGDSKNQSISDTAGIFLGISLAISLQYIINLPLWPWFLLSTIIIFFAIAFIYYINAEDEDSPKDILIKENVPEALKIIFIWLVSLLPFSIQKVGQKMAITNSISLSIFEGPLGLPKWALVIQIFLSGLCLIFLVYMDHKKSKQKRLLLGIIGVLVIITGIITGIIKW